MPTSRVRADGLGGGQAVNHLDEKLMTARMALIVWDSGNLCHRSISRGGGARVLELCMYAEGSTPDQERSPRSAPSARIEAFVAGPGAVLADPSRTPPGSPGNRFATPAEGTAAVDIPVDPTLLEAGDHNRLDLSTSTSVSSTSCGAADRPRVTLEDGAQAVARGRAQEAALLGPLVRLPAPSVALAEASPSRHWEGRFLRPAMSHPGRRLPDSPREHFVVRWRHAPMVQVDLSSADEADR